MRLRRDEQAASPLVVIVTVVLVAVFVTVIVYAVAFDRPEPGVALVAQRDARGALSFEVTGSAGGLAWDELELRLLDRGGSDLAASYLHPPGGAVDEGDVVPVEPRLPAGTYLLLVLHGGAELARVAVEA